MSYVEGRTADILVAPDGRWLGDSNFRSRIFDHIDVQQYKIIQEEIERIVVELIPGKKFDEKAENFIIKSMKKYLGEQVEITIKLKDEASYDESEKRRIVISRVTPNLK
jgi:phenylacetate-coenzyme A ligase PaaK-like adenylate-forming protein